MINRISQTLVKVESNPDFVNLMSTNFLEFAMKEGINFSSKLLSKLASNYFNKQSYHPDSRGLLTARQSICKYYKQQNIQAHVENIIITASTSESYSLIFNSLTNPGDEVLLPNPSYPLFEYLCSYSNLVSKYYLLDQDKNWQIDCDVLEKIVTVKTKGIILISPNNPTGSIISQKVIDRIVQIAKRRKLFIIFDEVFSEFRNCVKLPRPQKNSIIPIFYLNGISKMLALPDLKLAWIVYFGSNSVSIIDNIETVNDTYLNANYLTQTMLPELLNQNKKLISGINYILEKNRKLIENFLIENSNKITGHIGEGGIHCILSLISNLKEEDFVVKLLENQKVYLHPGYFYDLENKKHQINIVISLLTDPKTLLKGLNSIINNI